LATAAAMPKTIVATRIFFMSFLLLSLSWG